MCKRQLSLRLYTIIDWSCCCCWAAHALPGMRSDRLGLRPPAYISVPVARAFTAPDGARVIEVRARVVQRDLREAGLLLLLLGHE